MSQCRKKERRKREHLPRIPSYTDTRREAIPSSSREEEFNSPKFSWSSTPPKLVTSNLKFVVRVANEYKNYGFNTMDIIQEGNVGLMHAVKGFDPTKGYRLISYAVWWIRAYIQNYIIKSWSLVKVGTTQAQRKLFYKLRSTKKELEMGRHPLRRYRSCPVLDA
jgi:RNA polymerase sigma-32 factor